MQGREGFIYNGDKLPIGGEPGDVLVKLQGANFYCAWRDLSQVTENWDVVFDDGFY